MSKKNIFREIIENFIQRDLPETFPRGYKLPLESTKIISLLGPRRVGKTYLLFNLIKDLRKKFSPDRIVYLNFEDDRLFPLTLTDMDDFLRAYFELYPDNKSKIVYFFFDEVQEVENWEKFIRRIHDELKCRIFITGSSSKLLSRELASTLRGRTIPFEIFPLSFKEFLIFHNLEINKNTTFGKAKLRNMMEKYLSQGGFPELVFNDDGLHRKILEEYIDIMIYKDLAERFGVRNTQLVKHLLKYYLNNISGILSTNKIFNDFKSRGYSISKNTLYEYSGYLEEAFTIFKINKWDRSVKKQAQMPGKVYAIDPSLKRIMSISTDQGRVLENFVFLHFRRYNKEVYYYGNTFEVDFYIPDNKLYNVCYDLSDQETFKREIRGLLEGMHNLSLKESTLITLDEEGIIEEDGIKIEIIPFWKLEE